METSNLDGEKTKLCSMRMLNSGKSKYKQAGEWSWDDV